MTGEGIADPGELPPARFVVDRVHVTEEKSRTRRALSFMRSNPLFSIGLGLLIAFVGMAIIGPFLVGDPLLTNPAGMFSPPSADHWFGTDEYGRDVFARSVNAARLDLSIGLAIAFFTDPFGTYIELTEGLDGV